MRSSVIGIGCLAVTFTFGQRSQWVGSLVSRIAICRQYLDAREVVDVKLFFPDETMAEAPPIHDNAIAWSSHEHRSLQDH